MKAQSLFAVALCALAVAAQAAPQPQWTITDIGALGTTSGTPRAINNRGDVVGYSGKKFDFQVNEILRAYLWQNGVMQDLGGPQGQSLALNINDRGTIIARANGQQVYLVKDGQWSYLGFSGFPLDINRGETVVGNASTGSAFHAFMWRDGLLADLGTLGGTNSSANAVNDKNVIVGSSEMVPGSFVTHAFVYDNGVMRDLGTFGGKYSHANDINNHGEIVGWAEPAGSGPVAFIADASGNLRRLFPAVSGYASSINDHGAIVGGYGDRNSFLLDRDGTLTILEDIPAVKAAGVTRLFPVSINERGSILAWGFTPTGTRSFVLAPR